MVGKVDPALPSSSPMSTYSLFKWRHSLPDIILLNVRWYCRYALSYRKLEEMMQDRLQDYLKNNSEVQNRKEC